jgi:hypothetical protein
LQKSSKCGIWAKVGANNYSPLQRFPGGDRGEPCVHPAFPDPGRKKRYFIFVPVFFLLALLLPAAEAEEYLLMESIQDAFQTGDFNSLKDESENKVSINCEPPFKLNGYIYIEKFIDDFSGKFAQYETDEIQWISRHWEEKFAVQSLNLKLKNKRSEKTVYYKVIFFLKKVKTTAKTKVIKEWKIYYLRGLRI